MNWIRPAHSFSVSTRLTACLLVLMAFAPVSEASAQTNRLERSRYSPAAYYNYTEGDEVGILVNVWGSVRNPGLYEVPQGTRLNELFSLAGGPATGVQRFSRDQTLTVRLTRPQPDGGHTVVFETTMEDEVRLFSENPVLRENDVFTVERYVNPTFIWKDLFPIIGAASSVVTTLIVIFAK